MNAYKAHALHVNVNIDIYCSYIFRYIYFCTFGHLIWFTITLFFTEDILAHDSKKSTGVNIKNDSIQPQGPGIVHALLCFTETL